MKKRSCRRTGFEQEQHDRAIRVRKMTDAQLCAYLDELEARNQPIVISQDELEQYRRDEAAGLLLRLPVPLGATVWRVRDNPACHYGVREAEKFLFGRVVTPRRIVEPTPFTLALLDAWGKTVFSTEAEGRTMLEHDTKREGESGP